MIDDFLFICDGAYDQAELISMELDVFKTINYDLGFPLSYRFVRRYAKVFVLDVIPGKSCAVAKLQKKNVFSAPSFHYPY